MVLRPRWFVPEVNRKHHFSQFGHFHLPLLHSSKWAAKDRRKRGGIAHVGRFMAGKCVAYRCTCSTQKQQSISQQKTAETSQGFPPVRWTERDRGRISFPREDRAEKQCSGFSTGQSVSNSRQRCVRKPGNLSRSSFRMLLLLLLLLLCGIHFTALSLKVSVVSATAQRQSPSKLLLLCCSCQNRAFMVHKVRCVFHEFPP